MPLSLPLVKQTKSAYIYSEIDNGCPGVTCTMPTEGTVYSRSGPTVVILCHDSPSQVGDPRSIR